MMIPIDPTERPRIRPRGARKPGRSGGKSFCAEITTAIAAIACLSAACATPEAAPVDPASDPAWRSSRIESLRRAIDEDHATLEAMITRPGGGDTNALHEDPELRAIALRLGEREDELDRLEARERESQR